MQEKEKTAQPNYVQPIFEAPLTSSRKQSVHKPPTWLKEMSTTMFSTRHFIILTCTDDQKKLGIRYSTIFSESWTEPKSAKKNWK